MTLKAYFRHEMCEQIIDIMQDSEHKILTQEIAKQITISDSMYMLSVVWKKKSLARQSNIVGSKLISF